MKKLVILSPLSPEDWKLSWESKVVEDTRENQKATQMQNCYWGHFKNNKDFTLCFHREFEVKSMSMSGYFNGTLERTDKGCKITGTFGRKWSANLLLDFGIIFCTLVMILSVYNQQRNTGILSAVMLLIFVGMRATKPKKEQNQLLELLKAISSDNSFRGKAKKEERKALQKKERREREEALAEKNRLKALQESGELPEEPPEEAEAPEEAEEVAEEAAEAAEEAAEVPETEEKTEE